MWDSQKNQSEGFSFKRIGDAEMLSTEYLR